MRTIRAFPNQLVIPARLIFGLIGQSNMCGVGVVSQAPAYANAARIKNFSNAWTWVGAVDPLDSPTGQIDTVSKDTWGVGVGPGMSFASSLLALRPTIPEIGLVPCALSGAGASHWEKTSLSRSTLYGSAVARMLEAANQGELAGIIWYGGENDSGTLAKKDAYAARQTAMIANFRADLGIPDLPFIVTVLGPDPGPSQPYWTDIQAIQAATTGTKVGVADASDLTGLYDALHLNTASQVTLGARMAAVMNGLLA